MRLRDLGNTVLVVEHDEDTIRVADHVVDIGPGAGEHGGDVVYAGPVKGLLKSQALDHRPVPVGPKVDPGARDAPHARRRASSSCAGAREHNLKNVDVEFPLGRFVAVTGVSGSGKSTLVNDILFRSLMQKIYGSPHAAGPPHDRRGPRPARQGHRHRPVADRPHAALEPGHLHRRVRPHPQAVRPDPGGQGPRLPAGPVLASTSRAAAARRCAGDGTIKIEMHFLPDVYVPCEVCKGARYNRDTLDITFKGQNIADVLDMTCEEARRLLRQPAGHQPAPADARRRRPRLRPLGPAGHHAVAAARRSG